MTPNYDAILIVSFGGPEGRDDVIPFLQNVTRGRNIPEDRLAEVAEHYYLYDGVSPHNRQITDLRDALRLELDAADINLPLYWGNRNWTPYLTDTLRQMTDDGIRKAIAFVVSGYSSYSSCRQYRENVQAARKAAGATAPSVDKIRVFFNHPLFMDVMEDRVNEAIAKLAPEHQESAHLIFTAHSIPSSMAANCKYELQLTEASRLVAERFPGHTHELVYQSRSGPPHVPWLEPDICDYLENLAKENSPPPVIVIPIGFLSDHLEVLYDLDHEAADTAAKLNIPFARALSAGTHPKFITMIRELIAERLYDTPTRAAIGQYPASHDYCPQDCCLPPQRPAARPA